MVRKYLIFHNRISGTKGAFTLYVRLDHPYMKTAALLVSVLLLALGLWLLTSISLPSVSFYWGDFLVYLIIASVVYLIIRAVGSSLDNKFDTSVGEFLAGSKKELFANKALLRTFGFLLITLLPFLIYLLLFALYSAVTFAVYGLLTISKLPRVPIGILVGLAVVALGTGIAIFVGLYYLFFPAKRKTLGVAVPRSEQARLWNLTDGVAREIVSKPVDKIMITPDPGIGVYLEGNIFKTILGGGSRVLEIGIPSIHGLKLDEFKAILAHEYGHFSNRDTQWSTFTFAMGNSLLSTLRSTPGPTQNDKEQGGWITLITSLNPAYWILLLYVNLYFRVTSGFSRIREVMADIRSMELYGGGAFGKGLLKVAVNDGIFSESIQAKYVPDLLKKGKTIPNFSKMMDVVYQSVDEKTIEEFKSELLSKSAAHGIYDSHPALKTRIDYAKKFDQKDGREDEPLASVFDDWEKINERVAKLYNLRLLAYLQALSKASGEASNENKQCPACARVGPISATRCSCGYNFLRQGVP